MSGLHGFFRRVHQTEIDDFHAGAFKSCGDTFDVSFKSLFEAGKTWPVGFETNSKKTNLEGVRYRD